MTNNTLKFNATKEQTNSIYLFDVKIERCQGRIKLDIFRKPTISITDIIIDNQSNPPLKHNWQPFNIYYSYIT